MTSRLAARSAAIATAVGAGLAAVLDQDLEHRLDQRRRRGDRRQVRRQRPASTAKPGAAHRIGDRAQRRLDRGRRALGRDRHVGAGEVEQALDQQREPLGVRGDIGEEAAALLRAHRRRMVLQQFDRAA